MTSAIVLVNSITLPTNISGILGICTIYKYTNKINGKVYIGQTWCNTSQRAGKNGVAYQKSHQPYFGNAIKKYGWDNFILEIVCYDITQEGADFWEQHFIDKYDSSNKNKGYNIRSGGSRGKLAIESCKKLSLSKMGHPTSEEAKKKMSLAKIGKKLSKETKQKLSAIQKISQLGHKMHPDTLEKLRLSRLGIRKLSKEQIQYIKNDNRSNRAIGKEFGISHTTVARYKRGL